MIGQIITIIATCVLTALCINIWEDKIKHKKVSFSDYYKNSTTPIITFNRNGKEMNFILDSGSSVSAVDKKILKDFDIQELDGSINVVGVDGVPSTAGYCSMGMKFNQTDYYYTFIVKDFNNAFTALEQSIGKPIHGILGSDFMGDNEIILDFKNLNVVWQKWSN